MRPSTSYQCRDAVSDRDAAAVILNYVTAWQMIHRVAKVQTAIQPSSLEQLEESEPRRFNYYVLRE